jgi:MarR family transcriptional regulator, organic hydroperoxide resistance regulator
MADCLADTLGYALVRAQRAHRLHVAACLAPLGLHVGQEVLLSVLWSEDRLPQAELAARLGIEAPTVTRALDRLQRAGLVERRRDVRDARVWRVCLTARGRGLRGAVEACWAAADADMLAGLGPEECEHLRRLLGHLRTRLEDSGPATRRE